MNSSTKLKIGILGFGVVGKKRLNCIKQSSFAEVVAVSDSNPKALDALVGDSIRVYSDYQNLIRSENLDAIFVCLTNNVNPYAVCEGLKKGMHVFCEKPPGRSLQDLRLIEEQFESLDIPRVLMFGFNHRYHKSVMETKNLIDAEVFGPIVTMRGVYGKSNLITFDQRDWRTNRQLAGGGVLLDQGIHLVDLLLFYHKLGFDEVKSFVDNSFWKYDVEDNVFALLRNSKNNVVASICSSATQWSHQFHLEIGMERGAITLNGLLTGSKSYGEETLKIVSAEPGNSSGMPEWTVKKFNTDPSWALEVGEFLAAISEERVPRSGGLQEAIDTMALVEQIYRSDKNWEKRFLHE